MYRFGKFALVRASHEGLGLGLGLRIRIRIKIRSKSKNKNKDRTQNNFAVNPRRREKGLGWADKNPKLLCVLALRAFGY